MPLRVAVFDRLALGVAGTEPGHRGTVPRKFSASLPGSAASAVAANILNLMEPSLEGAIMEQVNQYNADLAGRIRSDVRARRSGRNGDRDIQFPLREVA